MFTMHSQINRAVSSAIRDRVIIEILNMVGSLSSGQRDTVSGTTSTNNRENSVEEMHGLKTELRKEDSRSAFDLRDTEDLSPNNVCSTCGKNSQICKGTNQLEDPIIGLRFILLVLVTHLI